LTRDRRSFTLIEIVDGEPAVVGQYTGYHPRDAALKCASASRTNIVLRESGTKKLHLFKGSREQVNKPDNAPDWLPAKVWKPNVKKIGVRHMAYNELARNSNDLFRL